MFKIDGEQIDVTIFPDNTSQVWKIPEKFFSANHVSIEWEFSHEGEFMQLAQIKELLYDKNITASLYMPYLPYGRQDKLVDNKSTFALRPFVKLLNMFNFTYVAVLDAHSPVAGELIHNFRDLTAKPYVNSVASVIKPDMFCYPDAGAMRKYSEMFNMPFAIGEKVRDQETGLITSYALDGDVERKKILIVDDICDGGMTFKILAKKLLDAGAHRVDLYVTHGIFSKGLRTLRGFGIDRIFTRKGEAFRGDHFGHIIYKPLNAGENNA